MAPSGNRREPPESLCCGNPTAVGSSAAQQLFLGSSRYCPQEETVLSHLEELHEHFFSSQTGHRYCDPWAGTRVSSCFRSIRHWLSAESIYSSLLLTASALRLGWANRTVSPLQLSDPTFCFSLCDSVSGLLGSSCELLLQGSFWD